MVEEVAMQLGVVAVLDYRFVNKEIRVRSRGGRDGGSAYRYLTLEREMNERW